MPTIEWLSQLQQCGGLILAYTCGLKPSRECSARLVASEPICQTSINPVGDRTTTTPTTFSGASSVLTRNSTMGTSTMLNLMGLLTKRPHSPIH